jgi:hypothetical protein
MFEIGNRVRPAEPLGLDTYEPVGTVTGFLTLDFAAVTGAPDDVLVRWDSGLELPHAPASLSLVLDNT